jgi:hypothetical protein
VWHLAFVILRKGNDFSKRFPKIPSPVDFQMDNQWISYLKIHLPCFGSRNITFESDEKTSFSHHHFVSGAEPTGQAMLCSCCCCQTNRQYSDPTRTDEGTRRMRRTRRIQKQSASILVRWMGRQLVDKKYRQTG